MDARNPASTIDYRDDEISLGDLVRGIWSTRAFAVAGGLVGVSVAAMLIFAQSAMAPSVASFRQDVELTLDGSGTYPNGTPFSANDLRSPAVLQRVYDETGLDEYDLSYRQFAASITITPASATYETIIERYRSRLSNASLTNAERQQIEDEFNAALSAALGSGATIAFTLPQGNSVPQAIGEHVVSRIPDAWAEIYINQLGVLNLPVPNSGAELIAPQFIASLDYPIAYDAIDTAFGTLVDRIQIAQSVSGAQNLTSPETGRSLFDISRDVDNLRRYSLEHVLAPLTELGLNKSPEITLAAYQYQIEDLDRQMRLARDNAAIIDSALGVTSGLSTAALAQDSEALSSMTAQLPTTIVQQFGPELVDRLIGMSVENAGVTFRENLLEAKLSFEAEALDLGMARDRLQQRLSLISGQTRIENQAMLETVFTEEADRLVTSLNDYWAEVESILGQANLERLSHDVQLFRALPAAETAPSGTPLFSRNNILLLIAAGLGGLLMGMAGYAIWLTVGKSKTASKPASKR